MILRRLSTAIARQDWFIVFIELIVLVVGIFIGLQVDDWNQARQDRAEERIYLEELREDLNASQSFLLASIEELDEISAQMTALLAQSASERPDWSIEQLNQALGNVHRMPTFFAVSRAWDNLTGAGHLKLIRNRELKNALAQYYAATELVRLVQDTHEMELVHTFQPYIIENLDYQAVAQQRVEDHPLPPAVEPERLLEVLHSREFRNLLTQKWTISTDLLNQHRTMLESTQSVIRMLESEMGEGEG